MNKSKFTIQTGQPIKIEDSIDIHKESPVISKSIANFLKDYLKSVEKLLNSKYLNQKDLMPTHLLKPCHVYVFYCTDGIFIRYDVAINGKLKIGVSIVEKDLAEIAPLLSDSVVHFPKDFLNYTPQIRGPQIVITKHDSKGEEIVELCKIPFELYIKTDFESNHENSLLSSRPECIISLSNEIIIDLEGVLLPTDTTPKEITKEEPFIVHSKLKLNVGWLAIQIYPLLPEDIWKLENAPLWAELDILAITAQHNTRIANLQEIDGRGKSRKYFSQLLNEFENLLTGLEEPVHQFLKEHPELLCPTHEKCWSKVPFGNNISDFVFKEAYNDYQLVEIEAPIRELFRKDGQQRQELTHAINQITDWIQYIQGNKQKAEQELGLIGISTNPRTLVVIGRSTSLTDENRGKLETIQALNNKLRILTYDDVLSNARNSLSRIFGSLDFEGQNIEIYFPYKH